MTPSVRLVFGAALLVCAPAAADPYDFRVYKLVHPDLREDDAAANAQFRQFVREFGAALTSVNLAPPETLGHSGFSINAELSVVQIEQTVENRLPTQQLRQEVNSS